MNLFSPQFLLLISAAPLFAAHTLAQAAVPLADSADGMTCHHYVVGSNLGWQRKGGDWVDAEDTPYGDRAYAVERVPIVAERQRVIIDVTPLAHRWGAGDEPAGAMLLRAMPGTRSGIVDFASREHPDPGAHPSLVVEWSDGSRTRLRPSADTYLPCSTVSSVGGQPVFKAGGDNAILVFPFEPRPDASVRKAELVLTSDKQYASASEIGVFRPLLPGVEPQAALSGIAGKFSRDQGIEKHPDVVFAERFESANWRKSWSDHDKTGDAELLATDPAERFEPLDGKSLRVTIRKGRTQGLNMHYRFARSSAEEEPEEIFFRYYLRFGESWDPIVDGGKMPGLSGTYGRSGWGGRRSDGRNGWAARGSFYRVTGSEPPLGKLRGIGSYVGHADMSDNHGDGWGWNLGPSGLLEKNRWYSIEQQVRMNSPGERDGVLRAWVDGELVFEKTDIRFRDVPELRIESLWMNVYHGGTKPAHKDLTLFIDNVVIARKYIGPFAGRP